MATDTDLTNVMIGQERFVIDHDIAQNVYSGLVRLRPGSNKVSPDLATSWTVSGDGLKYTFKLRKNVKFSGGFGPFTAADVVASFDYERDPKSATAYNAQFSLVKSVTAADPYTVVIELNQPYSSFLSGVLAWQSGLITSAKAIREKGADYLATHPVGTGPYHLSSYEKGQQITLTASKEYYAGEPAIKQVVYRYIPEAATAVLALQKGEVDVEQIQQAAAYRTVKALPSDKVKLYEGPGWRNYYAWLQCGNGRVTNDPRVRQALERAVDLKQVAQGPGAGMITVNHSYFNPTVLGWTNDLPTYGHDPAKAKSLLAEAGYKDPGQLHIKLIYYKSSLYEPLALAVTDAWRSIGITVDVTQIDQAAFGDEMAKGDWDAAIWGHAVGDPDLYAYNDTHSSGIGTTNYSRWNNSQADTLIEKGRTEQDTTARIATYKKLQALVAKDVPTIVLGNAKSIIAARPGIKGLYAPGYFGLIEWQYVKG